ncbi:MAG TPA: protease modulator HflC [Thermoanaerobaculia bacterium]|nr:protease modulator HflC [Thermoanaerobaculia bacterium]
MLRVVALAGALVLVLLLSSAVYQVDEGEQVIVTQFGAPVGPPVTAAGLHWKLPLVQKVHRFDRRFLEWDGEVNRLPTRDKRSILVDAYARWRITDPLLYFQRLRDERGARTRLDDIIDGETRDAIANHDLVELVRASNRTPAPDLSLAEGETSELVPIEHGREKIRAEILRSSQARTGDLGIEILDVRLKRLNYVEDVRQNVYNRMISERRRIAARYISEGQGEAARIDGQREREIKEITSDAYRQAEEIRGRADAEAAGIYAAAYDQSPDSRRFYELLESLETLQSTIGPDTSLILTTEGDFYRWLDAGGGG